MNLGGTLEMDGYSYFVQMHDIKQSNVLMVFTAYHEDDTTAYELGDTFTQPVLGSEFEIDSSTDMGYLLGAVKRLKTSGKCFTYGDSNVVESVLSLLTTVRNYKFAVNDVSMSENSFSLNEHYESFKAADTNYAFEFRQKDGIYQLLKINSSGIRLDLHQVKKLFSVKQIPFIEVAGATKKNILLSALRQITYQDLCDHLDMSWYKEGDVCKKDYKTIKTIREFELQVITPLVQKAIALAERGEQLDVAIDTETTGLGIYNLAPDNPDKDHCVAIPMSWEEDTGITVFTDMEFFHNVPNSYAVRRLSELFSKFEGERTIKIYIEETNASDGLQKLTAFSSDTDDINGAELQGTKCIYVTILRKWFNTIGHNVTFDGRVMFDIKATNPDLGIEQIYFDQDTLQMSFNLCPSVYRHSNGLKDLTRQLFQAETPDLTSILGRGNEDKYRYIEEEEIARIYGCADGDFTLKVFHALKKLTTPQMFQFYQKLDMPLKNILCHSEYYGMNTIPELLESELEAAKNNLEIIKNFVYEYVGSFISVYKQRLICEKKRDAGMYTDQQYQEAIKQIRVQKGELYRFELKASEIRKVIYDILKYPILAYTNTGYPKTDKYVIKKLIEKKRESEDTSFTRLERDVIAHGITREEYNKLISDPKTEKRAKQFTLISAEDFNKCKYPLALALQKYAELNKEYTSYFKPMEEKNLEGRMFYNYSMARIETRRIMNPGQTMKGSLKALIRSHNDDYYVMDWDLSTIEYRGMTSLAKHMVLVERLRDPEVDYHTETASLVNNIPAHRVDPKTRKKVKPISFGVPYGLGLRSLCNDIFGVVNDETLFMTRMLLAKWEESNSPIVTFLNQERNKALEPQEISKELRDFMGAWKRDENGEFIRDSKGDKVPTPLGFSRDVYGFYRTYDLSEIDQSDTAKERRAKGQFNGVEGKITRPAGNFPIQCFAAEFFRIVLIRFYDRCVKEGIADKIIWHMLIHDELLMSVHKSMHPFYMYKLLKESCMITFKDHTNYFVGINIGKTWAEAKDDSREAPIHFVTRAIARWDAGEFGDGPFWFDDPWEELVKDERAKYVEDRIGEILHKVQPDIDSTPINLPHILEHFTNYTVRAYVNDYAMNFPVDKEKFDLKEKADLDEYNDRVWCSKFETWAIKVFGLGKPIIDYDGRLVVLRDRTSEFVETVNEEDFNFVDYDDLFAKENSSDSDSYWSFDETEVNNTYESQYTFYVEEEEEDPILSSLVNNPNARNVAQMFKKEKQFNHLKHLNNQLVIACSNRDIPALKEYLKPFVVKEGYRVIFNSEVGMETWVKVRTRMDLHALDKFMEELRKKEKEAMYAPKHFSKVNKVLKVTVKDKSAAQVLAQYLTPYKVDSRDGYIVLLSTYLGEEYRLAYFKNVSLEELDKVLQMLK